MIKSLLREDKKAKTKAYWFKKPGTVLNRKIIEFLENYYKKSKKDVRVCMHTDPSNKHHDMVLLQKKRDFFKPWLENRKMGTFPHKHLKKGETYHLIKGKMACVVFSNSGKIRYAHKIFPNDIFRTPINTYHTQIPLTDYVIYHEGALGPFKKGNSVFPTWTDKFHNNKEEIKKFKKELNRKLK